MLTRAQINHIRQLSESHYRQQSGLFVAEGLKTVRELLYSPIETVAVYATQEHSGLPWLTRFGNLVHMVHEHEMQKLSKLQTPPGILAVCRIPEHQPDASTLTNTLTIALDGISDPGNMGTIIRTAEWFGVEYVFCSLDSADPWQPKVVQSAMGSLFRTKMIRTDLALLIRQAIEREILIYGAVMNGTSIWDAPLKCNGSLLIIGSESHGIRQALQGMIAKPLTIPRHSGSVTESLNAGIAAAVILSAFRRQNKIID